MRLGAVALSEYDRWLTEQEIAEQLLAEHAETYQAVATDAVPFVGLVCIYCLKSSPCRRRQYALELARPAPQTVKGSRGGQPWIACQLRDSPESDQ